jgi:MoaA/NifB/PqqE/SkfB family radical SAM enzyme
MTVMPVETMLAVFEQLRINNIDLVVLTGGEPVRQMRTLETAIKLAGDTATAISIQTAANYGDESIDQLFGVLHSSVGKVWSRTHVLQFNVSYTLSRTPDQTEALLHFLRRFGEDRFGLAEEGVYVEALMETCDTDGELDRLNSQIGSRLAEMGSLYDGNMKSLRVEPYMPIMVGRAKALRSTPMGEHIRELKLPLDFLGYRRLEQASRDLIAVDPYGFIYPSGIYMYQGVYPIGNIYEDTLDWIISQANSDPILTMISWGQAETLYRVACELYPEFKVLEHQCADPFEIVSDLLEDNDKSLALMDRAADWVLANRRVR